MEIPFQPLFTPSKKGNEQRPATTSPFATGESEGRQHQSPCVSLSLSCLLIPGTCNLHFPLFKRAQAPINYSPFWRRCQCLKMEKCASFAFFASWSQHLVTCLERGTFLHSLRSQRMLIGQFSYHNPSLSAPFQRANCPFFEVAIQGF